MNDLVRFDYEIYGRLLEHLFGVPCVLSLFNDEVFIKNNKKNHELNSEKLIDRKISSNETLKITSSEQNETIWASPFFLGANEDIFWLQVVIKKNDININDEIIKQVLFDITQCLVRDYHAQLSISGMSSELSRCYEEINMVYGLDEIWLNSHKLREDEAFEEILKKGLEHLRIDIAGLLIPGNSLCMHFSESHIEEADSILRLIGENLLPIIRNSAETLIFNNDKLLEITSGKVDLPYRFIVSGVSCDDKVNTGMVIFVKSMDDYEYSNSDRKICALIAREISKVFQTKRDQITGLLNRESFEAKLNELVNETSGERKHSLIYFDIDRFQIVNDNWGHNEGDRLLKQVGALTRSFFEQDVVISRMGGDEFGILLPEHSGEMAEKMAEGLRRAIQEIYFVSHGQIFEVSCSFGIAEINSDITDAVDALSAADIACHLVKETGKNGVRRYQPSDAEMTEHHDQMYWASRIKSSLQENQFELYGQKITPLSDEGLNDNHYEILIRLRDKNGKVIPPNTFIPAAERYNLMPLIDSWVLNKTLDLLSEYNNDAEDEKVCVSINISGQTLCNDDALNKVITSITNSLIDPKRIVLEITETSAVGNFDQALKFIHSLRAIGCEFSLDDFGSGMSSFGYLKHLPVSYLKIDGVFIRNLGEDMLDRVMVESIHTVAQAMGLKTVAEYVETEEIINIVKGLGIDYAQGFGIDKPSPFIEKITRLETLSG